MAAPIGNRFWEMADPDKIGRPTKFKTPKELWEQSCDYFKWCDDNPLQEEKLFHFQGAVTRETASKMRAYTIRELCLFLGCNEDYLTQFNEDKNKEFSSIITRIRDVIYTQKFTGAAADLLNANIIARELGMSDKQETNHTGEIKIIREIKK